MCLCRRRDAIWVSHCFQDQSPIERFRAARKKAGISSDFKFHTMGIEPCFVVVATPCDGTALLMDKAVRSEHFLVLSKCEMLQTKLGRFLASFELRPWINSLRSRNGVNRKSLILNRIGAGNEIRTRGLDLGKVALYQLSYTRASILEFTATLYLLATRSDGVP